jgi:hypothetical protein
MAERWLGARHNDAEFVRHGIDGLANIRLYGSDSYLGEVIPEQLFPAINRLVAGIVS